MTSKNRAAFAELLKEYRIGAGLTQEALAERAEISTRGIQALEQGQSQPQRETARRLAAAFGLPSDEEAHFLDAATSTPRRPTGGSDPFDALLRRYRGAADLTQEELAERARVSWRAISDLERAVKYPRKDTAALLADGLGLTGEERAAFLAAPRRPAGDALERWPVVLEQQPASAVRDQPLVYAAHAQSDRGLVTRLRADLQRLGVGVWVDEYDLAPGTSWEQAIRDAIRDTAALLLVASPQTRSSRYIVDELHIAELYGRRIYPLWIEGTQWIECIPLGWGGLQHLDARGERYDAALATLTTELERQGDTFVPALLSAKPPAPPKPDPPQAPEIAPRNPFKGLRAFTSADAGDFFGRVGLVNALLAALAREDAAAPRFLALVGASGSGKSSVVLAGLLPRLRAGALPESGGWVYLAPLAPGVRPLDALAQVLAAALPDRAAAAIRDELEDGPDALHRLATEIATQPEQRVVLVVDQCEELFAAAVAEEERRQCIDLLVAAATITGGPTLVLLTLRADFYDRPLRYPALGALLDARGMAILPATAADLRQAIEGPAALPDVRVTFDEDLIGDLLFDLRGEAGALPLLQFTLDQLFAHRAGRRLTSEAYRALGGVRGALARHAEATYAALPSDEHRRLARALFLRLIYPGATEQDTTRRRAVTAELALPDPDQTRRLREALDAFIAARLVVTTRVLTDPSGVAETTVEVSHEALIREWGRLGDWLREAREDIRRQQTISADAAAWAGRGRAADHLYRGSLLLEAEAWATRNMPSVQEAAFIDAARLERDVRVLEERQRQARQLVLTQQSATRLRALVGILALFLVVAAALSAFAVHSALQARQAESRAQRDQGLAVVNARAAAAAQGTLSDRDLALSANLAAQAVKQLGSHDDLALLLSVQAERSANTIEARGALLRSLESLPPRLVRFLSGPTADVRAVTFSPNGRIVAAGDDEGTIRLWDAASGQALGALLTGHTGTVNSLAFSSDGALLASGGADHTIRLWRRASAGSGWTALGSPLTGQQDQIRVVAFGAQGKLLASSSWDGSIWLWDLSGSKPRGTPLTTHAGDTGAMTFSRAGTILAASGLNDTTIQLWDTAHRQPLGAPITGPEGAITHIAFSVDGRTLAATADDGSLWLWDMGRLPAPGTPLANGINPASYPAFSPDGKTVALAGADQITLWDVATRRSLGATLSAHNGHVFAVAFSPNGSVLATGGAGHNVQIWNVAPGLPAGNPLATVFTNPNALTSVAFSPDGATIAAGDAAGHIHLWDVARHRVIGALAGGDAGSIIAVAFTPDGKMLATVGATGPIRLWDVARRRLIASLSDGHGNGVMSMAMSADGTMIAAAYPDATIRLWDVAHRRRIGPPLVSPDGEVAALAFSPNGGILASGSYGGEVRLWNVATHRPRGSPVFNHSGTVFGLAFSPDGTLLASVGLDYTVQLLDVGLDRPAGAPLRGNLNDVWNVAFSPDGNMLAVGSIDGPIQLWSVAYREQIGLSLVSGDSISALAFNHAGTQLAAAGSDGALWLWDMDVASWSRQACRIANRNLTTPEWRDYLGSAAYRQTCPGLQ